MKKSLGNIGIERPVHTSGEQLNTPPFAWKDTRNLVRYTYAVSRSRLVDWTFHARNGSSTPVTTAFGEVSLRVMFISQLKSTRYTAVTERCTLDGRGDGARGVLHCVHRCIALPLSSAMSTSPKLLLLGKVFTAIIPVYRMAGTI